MDLTKNSIVIILLAGLLLFALLIAISITGQKSVWHIIASWLGVAIFSMLLIMSIKTAKKASESNYTLPQK